MTAQRQTIDTAEGKVRIAYHPEQALAWQTHQYWRLIAPGQDTDRTMTLPAGALTDDEQAHIMDLDADEHPDDIASAGGLDWTWRPGHPYALITDSAPDITGGGVYIVRGWQDGHPAGAYIGQTRKFSDRLEQHAWTDRRQMMLTATISVIRITGARTNRGRQAVRQDTEEQQIADHWHCDVLTNLRQEQAGRQGRCQTRPCPLTLPVMMTWQDGLLVSE